MYNNATVGKVTFCLGLRVTIHYSQSTPGCQI